LPVLRVVRVRKVHKDLRVKKGSSVLKELKAHKDLKV
jgi:hypothetical protein